MRMGNIPRDRMLEPGLWFSILRLMYKADDFNTLQQVLLHRILIKLVSFTKSSYLIWLVESMPKSQFKKKS
jgi:hypothetical protein